MVQRVHHTLVYCVVLYALFIVNVQAHTYLSSVTVDGVKRTDCLRPLGTNSPISSVTSNDMTCGFLPKGNTPASAKCAISAGSTIGLQWNHNSPTPDDDIVDPSHKGPCLVYLSRDNGATWFKIYEDGYDAKTDTFCVITLINNKGYMSATIPSDIAPGDYILRAELIALHEAFKEGGAQPYVDCVELTGKGTAKPAGVAIPGAYSPTDPGILVNIYPVTPPYVIPGPPVYTAKATSGSGSGSGNDGGSGNNGDNQGGGGNAGRSSSSGMSAGGKAALSLFFIALAAGIVAGVYFYRKNGNLLGYTISSSGIQKSTNHDSSRKAGDYVAYEDKL